MRYAFVLLVTAFSVAALAEDTRSLEQLKQQEQLEKALDTINQLDAQMKSMTRQREADCAKAIGYAPFCSCIKEALPVAWSFAEYVAITTRTKGENGYEKLDAEYRAAYDKVAPSRDKCVRLINKKP